MTARRQLAIDVGTRALAHGGRRTQGIVGVFAFACIACVACSQAHGRPAGRDPQLRAADDDAGTTDEARPVTSGAGAAQDSADDDARQAMCSPDGALTAPPDDEAEGCPADKNLEGCPCTAPGEAASCWPAERVYRHRGQCQDGQTLCRDDGTWGACEGAVLPTPGATEGPGACRCFASGHWTLRNLVPCVYNMPEGTYLTSSGEDARTGFRCSLSAPRPDHAVHLADWSTSILTAECAGQFELCFTLKAGDVERPSPDDCTLQRLCVETWYARAGTAEELPSLPGWVSAPDPCTKQFVDEGGYGELSVLGTSADCHAVDDGHGAPYVFKRTRYCSTQCALTPGRPECKACDTGVSGQF